MGFVIVDITFIYYTRKLIVKNGLERMEDGKHCYSVFRDRVGHTANVVTFQKLRS